MLELVVVVHGNLVPELLHACYPGVAALGEFTFVCGRLEKPVAIALEVESRSGAPVVVEHGVVEESEVVLEVLHALTPENTVVHVLAPAFAQSPDGVWCLARDVGLVTGFERLNGNEIGVQRGSGVLGGNEIGARGGSRMLSRVGNRHGDAGDLEVDAGDDAETFVFMVLRQTEEQRCCAQEEQDELVSSHLDLEDVSSVLGLSLCEEGT